MSSPSSLSPDRVTGGPRAPVGLMVGHMGVTSMPGDSLALGVVTHPRMPSPPSPAPYQDGAPAGIPGGSGGAPHGPPGAAGRSPAAAPPAARRSVARRVPCPSSWPPGDSAHTPRLGGTSQPRQPHMGTVAPSPVSPLGTGQLTRMLCSSSTALRRASCAGDRDGDVTAPWGCHCPPAPRGLPGDIPHGTG